MKLKHIHRTLFLATAVLLVSPAISWGQFSTGSNSQSGLFGSRSIGSGGVTAGSRTFGGGQGALEQPGLNAGTLTGSERFVRGNRQPGQFVGSDSGEGGSFVGSASGGGAGQGGQAGLGGLGSGLGSGLGGALGGFGGQQGFGQQGFGQQGLGRQFGQVNQGSRGNTGRNAGTIRTTLRLGFTPQTSSPTVVSNRLTGLLERSSRIQSATPIQVFVSARTAILRGTVATEHERDLAQRVVLLEPGISQVQNELVVQDQPLGSAASEAAPATQP